MPQQLYFSSSRDRECRQSMLHKLFQGCKGGLRLQLSVAGHSTFPSVRARMADAALFPAALDGAYAITCIVACSIGGVGYWYWGDSAQVCSRRNWTKHTRRNWTKHMNSKTVPSQQSLPARLATLLQYRWNTILLRCSSRKLHTTSFTDQPSNLTEDNAAHSQHVCGVSADPRDR